MQLVVRRPAITKALANLIASLYCSLMCSNQLHQQNDSHNWTKLIPSVFRIARGLERAGGLR